MKEMITWESSNRIGSTTNLNHHSTIGWTSFRSTKKSTLWSEGLYFVSRLHKHYTLYVHPGRISSLLYINQLVAWWWCFCCYTTCKYLHRKWLVFRPSMFNDWRVSPLINGISLRWKYDHHIQLWPKQSEQPLAELIHPPLTTRYADETASKQEDGITKSQNQLHNIGSFPGGATV